MKKIYLLAIITLFSLRLAMAQSFSAGGHHSLFLCNNGTVMSCGSNYNGQLGLGVSTSSQTVPAVIPGLDGIKAVAAGGRHSLFLLNDGTVWACGENSQGQIGDGTFIQRYSPVQVMGLTDVIAIEAGYNISYFLKRDSTAWACGNNYFGELGDGTTYSRNIPVRVGSLTHIIAISGQDHPTSHKGHSLFLKNDGSVWACGNNEHGELGDGTTVHKNSPVQVLGVSGIIDIAAGQVHSLFLKNDGTVWGCGFNGLGYIGDTPSTPPPYTIPFQLSTISSVKEIAAGTGHSLFIKNDETVWACGANYQGQLGDGTDTSRANPVKVLSLTGVTAIDGGGHSLFLTHNTGILACGYNGSGQLGDGTFTDKHTPAQVTGLCSMITDVKDDHSENNISVYPNPSGGAFSINYLSSEKGKLQLTIMDAKGTSVYSEIISQFSGELKKDIDLGKQAKGIYFIDIISSNGTRSNRRVVLE